MSYEEQQCSCSLFSLCDTLSQLGWGLSVAVSAVRCRQQGQTRGVSASRYFSTQEKADFSVSIILCSEKKDQCCGYVIGLLWFSFQKWLIGKSVRKSVISWEIFSITENFTRSDGSTWGSLWYVSMCYNCTELLGGVKHRS